MISLRSCIGPDGEPEVLDKRGRPYLNTDTEDSRGNPCLGRGEVRLAISLSYLFEFDVKGTHPRLDDF